MKWKEIDLTPENPETDVFASVGNGCIKISKCACKLIKNIDECNFVVFQRAKKDRIFFLGLRFTNEKEKDSIPFCKGKDKVFGITISASKLVHTFYGFEGIDKHYTKHAVAIDPDNPDVLIIYYNYINKYYENDNGVKKAIRARHLGQILNEEWKVMSCSAKTKTRKYPVYQLKNINTGETIEISVRALVDIERGLTTVNNIKKCREIGTASWLGKKRAEKKQKLKAIDKK